MRIVALAALSAAAALFAVPGVAQTTQESTTAGAYTTAPDARPHPGDRTGMAALIPDGMTVNQVCDQFKSLVLCDATLHAAQNLGLNFTDLKHKVAAGEALSSAIHTLRPEVDANAEDRRAKEQARVDFQAPQG